MAAMVGTTGMARMLTALVVLGALLAPTGAARAQGDADRAAGEAAGEDALPGGDWQLGAGVGPMLLLSDACRVNGGDVVDCTTMTPFMPVELAVDAHVQDWLWVGVHAGYGFEPGSGRGTASTSSTSTSTSTITSRTEERRGMWRFGMQARVQERPADGPYGALLLSALLVEDTEDRFDVGGGSDRPTGAETVRQWGISPGLGGGYDFAMDELVSLGLGGSVSWIAIDEPETDRVHYAYEAGLALELGLSLRFVL